LGSRVDFSNIGSHEMRSSPSGLSGLAPLLPLRNNEVPIRASELQELLSWTLHEPDGLDGWEKEAVSDLTVYRLTETDEANPGRPVERGRCEVVLDAPIETVFALVDDPKQRATWDDIVGQSMQKYKSRGHSLCLSRLKGSWVWQLKTFFFGMRNKHMTGMALSVKRMHCGVMLFCGSLQLSHGKACLPMKAATNLLLLE